MLLARLFPGAPAVRIGGLAWDSRRVRPGDLFFAIPGRQHDGHAFIEQAISRGAVAVVGERPLDGLPVPYVLVDDVRGALARAAAWFYGHPTRRLVSVGVTGTDGKTTVVHFLGQLLPGCEVLSTVRVEREGLSCVTTPEAPDLHRIAASALRAGRRFFAFEASSIGLAQRRLEGIRLVGAVFTGLSRDHLDFHGTIQAYLEAKLRILSLLSRRGCLVVNGEDERSEAFLNRSPTRRIISYGLRVGDVRTVFRREGEWHTDICLAGPTGRVRVRLPFPGAYNVQNALAASSLALCLGFSPRYLGRRLARIRLPPGRLERFRAPNGATVIVDYAHTPGALRAVLALLRPRARRLLVVFGAAGDSDAGKRPLMGEAVGELADFAVVTSDNPKGEGPADIAAAVAGGLERAGGDYTVELNRKRAIRLALDLARAGDIVLIAGKGHERFQLWRDRAEPHSDTEFLLASGLARPA